MSQQPAPRTGLLMADSMIYLNGSKSSFRCHCGCNVFDKIEPDLFECNACGELYEAS